VELKECIHDGGILQPLVGQTSSRRRIGRVFGDGPYNPGVNFGYLYDERIELLVKVRRNSSHNEVG
jgi:hypothetical protein